MTAKISTFSTSTPTTRRREVVGYVYVDSATIMVGDPSYVLPDDSELRDDTARDWATFCDKTSADIETSQYGTSTPFGAGIAFVTHPGNGDGIYPVELEFMPDGRPSHMTVTFIAADED